MTITNTGTVSVGLAEYIIKDSRGDTYINQTSSGPNLAPGYSATVRILLTGQLSGQPFQFQTGQTYSLQLVTKRNNPFPYTFTA
ncbi:MAG TPA: hypothetical protein VFE96_09425 [Candidatus Bathyarchaeia archaeon]|nr:hypothetical protein [Candidatus Bathyarchaeia archaeon]